MTGPENARLQPLLANLPLALGVGTLLLALMAMVAIFVPEIAQRGAITDYDIFHVVGLMTREGIATDAYSYSTLLSAQMRLSGSDNFMPWAYPPPFNLVVGMLATLTRGLGYALFVGLSLGAWLWVIAALAGRYASGVLLMLLPSLLMLTLVGQNGYLTGALVGAVCLAALAGTPRGRIAGGIALGLMVIKPHLALGLGLMVLVRRDWRALGVALGVAGALCAVSTLIMGPAIWGAFLNGTREAGAFLQQGAYPLFRMTSVYALLRSLGLGAELAMAAQLALALGVGAAIVRATLDARMPARRALALACAGGLLFSPYSYDYDLPVLGVALALVARDFALRARSAEICVAILLAWVAGGTGLVLAHFRHVLMTGDGSLAPVSPAPVALLALLALGGWVLSRQPPAAA